MILKKNLSLFILVFIGAALLFSFFIFASIPYLTFSDGAKYADVARNVIKGLGYGTNFYFFPSADFNIFSGKLFPIAQIPPLMPFSVAVSFLLFGISDLAVVATSSFYFILLTVFIYLLGRKVFGRLVGFLAAITVLFNPSLVNYASSGASETLFAFEIVLGAYLFILKKKWADLLGFITLIMLYFTRTQAFIYIAGLIFLGLLLRFPIKKALSYFILIVLAGIFSDIFILRALSGKFFLYSLLGTSQYVLEYVPGSSSSELLRGIPQQAPPLSIFNKVLYNFYNFYKLLPGIASPYLWALFMIGLFKWGKDKLENSFKVATIFIVVITFLVTALTIPLFRYLHPVVPLVYLFAVATLVWVVEQMANYQFSNSKQIPVFEYKISKKTFINLTSTFLILFFVVGQTLGVIFLDSRFKARMVNKDKPPVYVLLSRRLQEISEPTDVVVTNLDTWGSWYGERKTIWYPLKPEQLRGLEDKVDSIYLTSYLIDDENYFMGAEWRQIFETPKNIKDKYVAENYKFAKEIFISSDETHERMDARAILLVRK